MNFKKLARLDQLPGHVAVRVERRDRRHNDDQSCINEQLGDLCDTADILNPVGIAVHGNRKDVDKALKDLKLHP